jgi:rod shape-determining protein MreC
MQNGIKDAYRDLIYLTSKKIDIIINNNSYIDSLFKLTEDNQRLNLLSISSINYINSLLQFNKIQIVHPKIKKARMISFIDIMDYNRLWIKFDDFNSSKMYGLAYDNYAIGIGAAKDNKPIAILNADKKCSYSVHIGKKRALGIMSGSASKINDNLVVKYIPSFEEVNIGDEVVTSGLDGIFFRGVKVGVVKEISSEQGYKKAIIKPYFKYNQLSYFLYVIDL